MYQNKKSVLIFGAGPLQKSIIDRAKLMGLYTVGIDPCPDAFCKDEVNAFEVVEGQDFEGTCAVVEKYGIDAIVTAATDKPLVMMARIAERYGFAYLNYLDCPICNDTSSFCVSVHMNPEATKQFTQIFVKDLEINKRN